MGWSDGEQLLCVQESGDVLVYDMFGAYQRTFNMGQEVRDTKVGVILVSIAIEKELLHEHIISIPI